MASTRSVLIVGAGAGQLPAIRTAQRLGWRAVTVDRSPAAPGMSVADVAEVVDVVDLEGVLAVARSQKVDGVLTMQSDLPVPTVGYVNEKLNLPGVTFDVARNCSRKDLARDLWREAGVPQPAFEFVSDPLDGPAVAERVGYPCVVKAPDSSGSRGVVKVSRPDQVAAAIAEAERYSRVGGVLIEAFVDGLEVGAQTFSQNGKCELVLLHNDQVSAPPYMVPIGHSYPFREDGVVVSDLREVIARAVETLGIADGPSNVDVMIGPDGQPMLLEVGARIGATCLPELTTLFTGLDWVELALRKAVGEQVVVSDMSQTPSAARIIESPSDGVLRGYRVAEWIEAHPGVASLELSAQPGDEVSRLRKGTDRIGSVLTRGADLEAAEELCAAVVRDVEVLVE